MQACQTQASKSAREEPGLQRGRSRIRKYGSPLQFRNLALSAVAGIKEAVHAKARFDNKKMKSFERSTASFLADPVGTPRPVLPGCQCAHCRRQSLAPSSTMASGFTTPSMGSSVTSSIFREYDPEADAKRPKDWDRRYQEVGGRLFS